jgi:hypothetical protein
VIDSSIRWLMVPVAHRLQLAKERLKVRLRLRLGEAALVPVGLPGEDERQRSLASLGEPAAVEAKTTLRDLIPCLSALHSTLKRVCDGIEVSVARPS